MHPTIYAAQQVVRQHMERGELMWCRRCLPRTAVLPLARRRVQVGLEAGEVDVAGPAPLAHLLQVRLQPAGLGNGGVNAGQHRGVLVAGEEELPLQGCQGQAEDGVATKDSGKGSG